MSSTITNIYINKIKSYCHVSSLFFPCFSINIKKKFSRHSTNSRILLLVNLWIFVFNWMATKVGSQQKSGIYDLSSISLSSTEDTALFYGTFTSSGIQLGINLLQVSFHGQTRTRTGMQFVSVYMCVVCEREWGTRRIGMRLGMFVHVWVWVCLWIHVVCMFCGRYSKTPPSFTLSPVGVVLYLTS